MMILMFKKYKKKNIKKNGRHTIFIWFILKIR